MNQCYSLNHFRNRSIVFSFLFLVFSQLLHAQTVVINTGTAGTPAYNAGPIYRSASSSSYDASRYAYLYTQSELAAAGIFPGSVITVLGWAKNNTATTTGGGIFRIYMKNSSAADFSNASETWANLNSGTTMVYENTSQTIPATAFPSYIDFTLNTPFTYTGGSLEISTEWDINQVSGNPTTGSFEWMWSTVTDRIYGTGNTTLPINTLSSTTNSISTINDRRPFLQLTFIPGSPCTSPPTAGTATSSVTSGVCMNSPVMLNLSGNSVGSGQSYQWQTSTTSGGTYTDMGSSQVTPQITIHPTTTLWYRAAVTCSGNTVFSTPVQVVVNPAFPSGVYTINAGLPTGGTNFHSFADAVSAISCGIAGPVTFNVTPGSGPYNEQVEIPEVQGASATNTITFNGNGETLQTSPTSSARHIIWLNGTDFITIKKLNITGTNATYGWGIFLSNGADHNLVDSCTININAVTSTTTDNSAGIVVSGSASDLNADGNANSNTFSSNTIIGGYQGIIINGTAGSINGVDNVISKNSISDFYANGIEVTDQDHVVITGNDIQRANRTGVTTFEGIELGTGNMNAEVSGNRIHDTHNSATSQTGTAYGIYATGDDAPAGSPNRIFNNLIYNFNSGSGSQYGIYNSSSNGFHYYHNTIVLDNAASTAGITRGFYQITTASDVEFRNNIVYITRGGTGSKNAVYFSTTTSSILSNNNDLYVDAPGTVGIGTYGSTNFVTLADWQGANNSAYDQQSMSVDPAFAGAASGNFYPNNSSIASIGAAVGITTDIAGTPRDPATPTPGAYEIIAATGADMGVKALLTPVQKNCYSSGETVTVTIRNYSANPINFSSKPTTVHVAVTGPNAFTFAPVVINSGTLAADDTLNVVISNSYNMSAPGNYEFTSYTTVTGDANAANDAMPSTALLVEALAAGTAASNPPSYCITGGIPTLSLTGNSGGSIQWQTAGNAAGPWSNVGTNDPVYIPASAISSTTYYQAIVSCGANADTSNLVEVLVSNPQILTTMPVTRCGPGTVPLGATASAGATIEWYTDAAGGSPIATGNSFTTPILGTTTTYYVSAMQGGGLQSLGANSITAFPNSGTNSSFTAGLEFTADAPVQIQSVDIFPTSAIGTNFIIAIRTGSGSGPVVATYQGTTTVQGSVASPVAQTVPVNFNLAPGNYVMTFYNGALQPPATGNGVYPGALRNNPATGVSYPYSITGLISITGGTANNSWYYFYNWQILTGCHSPRQAVTATISQAPDLTITSNTTICNNAIKALSVTSPLTNFDNYTWSPDAGLYTDAAATTAYTTGSSATTVYVKNNVAGTYTYVLTANNNSTSCQNIDSIHVTILPDAVTINSTNAAICVSGTSTLSLVPSAGYDGGSIQWMSSVDGGTSFNPVSGANGVSYTTPVLTSTTIYRAVISDGAGNSCQQPEYTLHVNNPQVLTTTDGARCDPGTVTLGASSSPNTLLNWFDAPSGGSLVGTGTTFTTPSLNATTSYYVSAFQTSSTLTAGRTAPLPNSSGFSGNNYGIVFNATSPFTLTSVDVYPSSTTAGSVEVQLTNSSGGVIYTAGPFTLPAGTGTTVSGGATPVTLNLGFDIPVGNGYRLRTQSSTGNLIRDNPIGSNFSYPLNIGTVGSITGGLVSGTSSTSSYWFFYNWQVSTGCSSAREEVTAMISSATTILQQPASISTCAGSAISFAVNATGANLSYQWRKNGSNISGATGSTYTILSTSPSDAGDYDVVITGLCGNITSSTASLTVASSNSWLGAVSSDWNNPANWCGGVPTAVSDIVINSGTPFQPTLTGVGNVHHITLNTGAVVSISPTGFLNILGNLTNNGSFDAPNGSVAFKGNAVQSIGTIQAGNIHMNGAGITLSGHMTAGNMVLSNGNIILGDFNLNLGSSTQGSAASHVVTNGSGSVTATNISANAVTIPVGPSATTYNPVTISNGQGHDFSVKVATGINPAINNPSRAINRTWNIQTNATGLSPVNILLQYESSDANAAAVPTAVMEVGVNNGTGWNIPAPSVTPSGAGSTWQVGLQTAQFGSMVVANVGGISFPTATPNVDPSFTRIILMPNMVKNNALLRIQAGRADRMVWEVLDMTGRVVMHFNGQVSPGVNDIPLHLGKLSAGVYHLVGRSSKGITPVVRFVKE